MFKHEVGNISCLQDTLADIHQDLDESDDWKDQVDFVDSQELPFLLWICPFIHLVEVNTRGLRIIDRHF